MRNKARFKKGPGDLIIGVGKKRGIGTDILPPSRSRGLSLATAHQCRPSLGVLIFLPAGKFRPGYRWPDSRNLPGYAHAGYQETNYSGANQQTGESFRLPSQVAMDDSKHGLIIQQLVMHGCSQNRVCGLDFARARNRLGRQHAGDQG
jgi:hypothetical protein